MADKEKDPAFLFYPLDWLQGTASLFLIEKAVYFDLLCHQHQDGSLPNNTDRLARMVGMPVDQFLSVWSTVRLKFVDRPGDRLVNLRLEKEVTKRSTSSHKNAIIGRLAVLVRTSKGIPKEVLDKIKEKFNVIDYEPFSIEDATIRLTNWWTERLTYYQKFGIPFPIENENENKDRLDDDKGGPGEEEEGREGFVWNAMPGIPQHSLDLPEMQAGSARELMHFNGNEATLSQVADLWGIFKVQNFTGKNFYQYPEDAYRHFINWSKTQKVNGKANQPRSANGKSSGATELADKLAKKLATGGKSNLTS